MTDAEIIAIAERTKTAEPGRDGYVLPISFARAILAAQQSEGSVPPAGPLELSNGEIHTAYIEAANQTLRPQDERLAFGFARAILDAANKKRGAP